MPENFLGLRGTLDWETNEDPQNWRQGIFRLRPNGSAQILGILSMLGEFGTMEVAASKSKGIPSTQHNWWTQKYKAASGAVTGVFTDSGLTTAYTSGGAIGTQLYIKMALATAERIRIGHQVLLMYTGDSTAYATAEVLDVVRNGTNSYAKISLLEADDNSVSFDLSDADRILVVGNINAQGGRMPQILAKNPTQLFNYPQIFRTPFGLTTSAETQVLRTEDPHTKERRNAGEDHAAEMEWALIWSVLSSSTGENGNPKYTMDGLVSIIRKYAPDNVYDYRTDPDFAGLTWEQGGEAWLNKILEVQARYNSDGYLVESGGKALTAVDVLARTYGHINLSPGDIGYGIKTARWMSPHGEMHFRQHPLMALEPLTQRMALGIPASVNIEYMPVIGWDTDIHTNRQANDELSRIDEYITECTIQVDYPDKLFVAFGFGEKNTV
jgi:hypothetical protein